MIKQGNLIDEIKQGNYDVFVHGCNCYCVMGAGIAKQLKQLYPAVYEADLKTIKGDKTKLGTYTSAVSKYKSRIINNNGRGFCGGGWEFKEALRQVRNEGYLIKYSRLSDMYYVICTNADLSVPVQKKLF